MSAAAGGNTGAGGRTGPLAHLRVVELPGLAPVPFAGMLLADLGAEVVRVARPPHARAAVEPPETGPLYRGRSRVVVLDLKDGDDLAELLDLADRADVLIEGFRPGVMERLGAGPSVCCERNPALVYGRLTGWGQDGPLAGQPGQPGHDISYLALSGALGAIGPAGAPPVVPVNHVADFGGGSMLLVTGVLAALAERDRSGCGQVLCHLHLRRRPPPRGGRPGAGALRGAGRGPGAGRRRPARPVRRVRLAGAAGPVRRGDRAAHLGGVAGGVRRRPGLRHPGAGSLGGVRAPARTGSPVVRRGGRRRAAAPAPRFSRTPLAGPSGAA